MVPTIHHRTLPPRDGRHDPQQLPCAQRTRQRCRLFQVALLTIPVRGHPNWLRPNGSDHLDAPASRPRYDPPTAALRAVNKAAMQALPALPLVDRPASSPSGLASGASRPDCSALALTEDREKTASGQDS
jgi:hypothetical protein